MKPFTAAVFLAFFVTPVHAEDPKKVLESLQGEWKLTGLVKNGIPEQKGRLAVSRLTVSNSNMTIDDGVTKPEATFTIDPTANPPTIDIKLPGNAGNSQIGKGIYKLEKDQLTICFGLNSADRPTEFKSEKGAAVGMWGLTRVKK